MIDRRGFAAAALGSLGALAGCAADRGPFAAGRVPAEPESPALARGVNLSAWLERDRRQKVWPADLRGLERDGFDHVRLNVDFEVMGWDRRSGQVPGIGDLDRALAMTLDAGLDAVIDCHGNAELRAELERDAAARAGFAALWRSLAKRYADLPSGRVAFELLNEPQHYAQAPAAWLTLQRRLHDAAREHAPDHLILLTGRKGSRIDTLAEVEVLPRRTAAVFHFYAPYVVTHQGASWAFEGTAVPDLRAVPYPARLLDDSRPRLASDADPTRAKQELAAYAAEGWDAAKIAAEVEPAARWARERGVRVLCNEFGVYRKHATPATRWRWLGDVRSALEAAGIGWTVWDYADTFAVAAVRGPSYTARDGAVVAEEGASRRVEPGALAALGLAKVQG